MKPKTHFNSGRGTLPSRLPTQRTCQKLSTTNTRNQQWTFSNYLMAWWHFCIPCTLPKLACFFPIIDKKKPPTTNRCKPAVPYTYLYFFRTKCCSVNQETCRSAMQIYCISPTIQNTSPNSAQLTDLAQFVPSHLLFQTKTYSAASHYRSRLIKFHSYCNHTHRQHSYSHINKACR